MPSSVYTYINTNKREDPFSVKLYYSKIKYDTVGQGMPYCQRILQNLLYMYLISFQKTTVFDFA